MEKIRLLGGRSTKNVFRIGETVVRPHQKNSVFTNDVLKFLEKKQYRYSHRFIDTNADGDDVYKFVNGFVPREIGDTTIDQLCKFMVIVRQMHDLTSDQLNNKKVICHNDLSPCNVVFVDNAPACIIDWDSAAYGERWEDITYILWLWTNIGDPNKCKTDILIQMRQALIAYGIEKIFIQDLAAKFIIRMEKVKTSMSVDNYQYERTCKWVEYSKIWILENKDLINKILE